MGGQVVLLFELCLASLIIQNEFISDSEIYQIRNKRNRKGQVKAILKYARKRFFLKAD